MVRKIKNGMKFCFMLILTVLLIGIIIQAICKYLEVKKIHAHAYGQLIDVGGRKMNVEIRGNGSETIVILPALGDASPVLEFRQMAGLLSKNFKVITVEPFGYGLSDGTDRERTPENISEELHACLNALGCQKYYLMAHSISGAYSVYYAETYPDEVKGVIGLDISVPGMYSEVPSWIVFLEDINPYIEKAKTVVGFSRLSAAMNPNSYIPAVEGYDWSQDERRMLKWITLDKAYNKTLMDEVKRTRDNLDKMQGLKFPNNVPVLYFLSENNSRIIPAWQGLHEDLVQDKERSKMVMLSGSHYVYYGHGSEIAETASEWILNLQAMSD